MPGTTYGCTDPVASNYDASATTDDGSCEYPGCMDSEANNYDFDATVDDGSCTYDYYCRDQDANNYSSQQPGRDDNSLCEYDYYCRDRDANNYSDARGRTDNSRCTYNYYCRDSSANNADLNSPGKSDNSKCRYNGCTDKTAKNYKAKATDDDNSCYYTCEQEDYDVDRCTAVCSGNYDGCIHGNATGQDQDNQTWTCSPRE
jgi:hypothetical protein